MTEVTETTVRKEVRSRNHQGRVDVDITVCHHDSEQANDTATRLYHAVREVLDE